MGEIRTKGLSRFIAAADQRDKEGHLVTLATDIVTVGTSATAEYAGVIIEGGEKDDFTDIALLGAYNGTCHFRAGDNITSGKRLMAKNDGTVDCAATGLCVGMALEAAVAGELFEAAPRTPVTVA